MASRQFVSTLQIIALTEASCLFIEQWNKPASGHCKSVKDLTRDFLRLYPKRKSEYALSAKQIEKTNKKIEQFLIKMYDNRHVSGLCLVSMCICLIEEIIDNFRGEKLKRLENLLTELNLLNDDIEKHDPDSWEIEYWIAGNAYDVWRSLE